MGKKKRGKDIEEVDCGRRERTGRWRGWEGEAMTYTLGPGPGCCSSSLQQSPTTTVSSSILWSLHACGCSCVRLRGGLAGLSLTHPFERGGRCLLRRCLCAHPACLLFTPPPLPASPHAPCCRLFMHVASYVVESFDCARSSRPSCACPTCKCYDRVAVWRLGFGQRLLLLRAPTCKTLRPLMSQPLLYAQAGAGNAGVATILRSSDNETDSTRPK